MAPSTLRVIFSCCSSPTRSFPDSFPLPPSSQYPLPRPHLPCEFVKNDVHNVEEVPVKRPHPGRLDSGRFYPLLVGTGRDDVKSVVGLHVPNIFREDGVLVCLHHHQGVVAPFDDRLDVIMLGRGASIEIRHAQDILSVGMLLKPGFLSQLPDEGDAGQATAACVADCVLIDSI